MKNLIVIASSAGGPEALKILIPSLPKNIAASIVVIQHMPIGFTDLFARRLDDLSEIDVREIKNDIRVKRGKVYIAKSGSQIRLVKNIRSVYFKSFEDKTDNLDKRVTEHGKEIDDIRIKQTQHEERLRQLER